MRQCGGSNWSARILVRRGPVDRGEAEGHGTVTRIRARRGWVVVDLRELWDYRELLFFLVWRDLKVRYKRTIVGAAWAIIQPVMAMVVFSVFFGRLAQMPSDDLPYPLFAFAALVPWTYFANALNASTNSVIEHRHMISKVYFPRVFLPAASVAGGLVDLGIALAVLVMMMAAFRVVPSTAILALPLFVLLAVACALAVGLWFSALNVLFRDVRYAVPFLIQFWLFASPVAYSSSLVPEEWRAVYGLNPMTGVIDGVRWSVLGAGHPPGPAIGVSVFVVLLLLISGLVFFRTVERRFADVA